MTPSPIIAFTLSALLVLGSAGLRAEDPSPQGSPPSPDVSLMGNGLLPATLAIYDADDSGDLSVEEKQAMDADRRNRHLRFRERWDTNKDGRISPTEQEAAKISIRELIRQRRLQRFREVDVNDPDDRDSDGNVNEADGFLSRDEFGAINAVTLSNNTNPGIADAIFDHIDGNDDGRISENEFLKSLEVQPVDPTGTTPTAPPAKTRRTVSGN